jgi:gamma-glutamyl phosphate reductase
MEVGAKMGLSSAMLDRLKLDDKRIAAMAKGLREVAACLTPSAACWMSVSGPTAEAAEGQHADRGGGHHL